MPVLPCPETPAVTAAVAAGTLARDPRLAAHVQICNHCLSRVFGEYRALTRPAERREGPPTKPPEG